EEQLDEQEMPAAVDDAVRTDGTAEQAAPAPDEASETSVIDLAAMHTQLAQLTAASQMLAWRMEEQGRLGERRRAAVQEARDQIETLLAQFNEAAGTADGSAPRDLGQLIDVTRQAA